MESSRTELENLLQGHWQVGWIPSIDCGSGWDRLIADFHHKACRIDPNYKICQIKEKFGGLRVYYEVESNSADIALRSLAGQLERESYLTCELTGQPGRLMRRSGLFKTLSDDFVADGWVAI